MQITVATNLEHRLMYVLCLLLLIFPVVSQLSSRRIKKTFLIRLIILAGIAGFTGISASLFTSVPVLYTTISWGLFLASLAVRNCSIFFHSLQILKYGSIVVNPDRYKLGLFAVFMGTILELAMIYSLKDDLYLYSAIGIIGHAVTLMGCFVMRISASLPKSNIS
jgi:hypothetical protein